MGHYYSYIKDRESNQWYEFNDAHVSPFNIQDLEKEAFGKND
jgi:ubiquitin C-terminal hydrolase